MGIRRWISGTLRADRFEADEVDADSVDTDSLSVNKSFTVLGLGDSQNISNNTVTEVEFESIEADNLNAADVANNRIAMPEDGKYLISASIDWSSNEDWSTGDRAAPLPTVNGSVSPRVNSRRLKISTGREDKPAPTFAADLSSGDHVTLNAFQDSGSDQEMRAETQLIVVKLG